MHFMRLRISVVKLIALSNPVGFSLVLLLLAISKKLNLHYTLGITPKSVTSGGAYLRDSAPGQRRVQETKQRWRAVGDTASDLTGPGIEPQISYTDSKCLTIGLISLINSSSFRICAFLRTVVALYLL